MSSWMLTILGDRYNDDDQPTPVPSKEYHGNLDDINNWDKGGKSMTEEAIDKVKEFVNKVKSFDDAPDYGWVGHWFVVIIY